MTLLAAAPSHETDPGSANVVRGDMLSCFTASISSYMATQGIDYRNALGTQLFLAVRSQPEGDLPIAFAHYHTPLRGATPTHRLEIERRRSLDAETALNAIFNECRRSGAAIVVGDGGRLPWLVGHGVKHVPHWFVLDAVSPDEQLAHVTDRFAFIDDQGTQEPFDGWIERSRLVEIIGTVRDWAAPYRHRERWAFGSEELGLTDTADGLVYDWFELTAPVETRVLQRADLMSLLLTTVASQSGDRRPEMLPGEWLSGIDAIRALPDLFAARLSDPSLYAVSDDLWVIARTRQLFSDTVGAIGDETGSGELSTFARACGEALVTQWLALPRIMRYNASCLERGRSPRGLLVDLMRQIVDLEVQFMAELSVIVEREMAA